MKEDLLVIDCQYDFIEGSLACVHSKEAVKNIVDYINAHDLNVYYSLDWHNDSNKSFKINGGIWPVHCVQGEKGSKLDDMFYEKVQDEKNKPNEKNMFYKGMNDDIEEYSAFNAKNKDGDLLNKALANEVIVCGIASEFCVRETVLDLLKSERKVKLLLNGLGYVDEKNHIKNIEELKELGVEII